MTDQSPEAADPREPGDPGQPQSPDMAAFEADLAADSEENSQIAQAAAHLEEAREDLARARADFYNLNQEYGNYVRRAKESASTARENGQADVAEALLGVLDDIEAARGAGQLEGPFAAIAAKLEDILATRLDLVRYGEVGEEFDPGIHEALMAQTNPDVDHPVVAQVLQSGYRMKERILRATKVTVDNPE